MFIHIMVKIDGELKRITNGEGTVLDKCSNTQARNILQKAKEEGKTFWAGCDNMKEDGSCGGHEN